MEGWIKLHRSLLEWEWFTDSNTLHVFIYLLLKAFAEDGEYKGVKVKRGSIVTSVKKISEGTGLSIKAVRTALEHLKNGNQNGKQIEIKTTNLFSVISICKYEQYQVREKEGRANKTANKGQTSGNPKGKPTEEEYKNNFIIQDNKILEGENQNRAILPTQGEGKGKRDLGKIAGEFMRSLEKFVGVYPNEMLQDFARYWTEPNRTGTKLKFELQQTWSMAGRLSTWAKNEPKFSANRTGAGAWSQGVKNDSKSTLEALIGN